MRKLKNHSNLRIPADFVNILEKSRTEKILFRHVSLKNCLIKGFHKFSTTSNSTVALKKKEI